MRPVPHPVGPGQESVWDYPRPPRCEKTSAHIEIEFGGVRIASTDQAYRILETSHPPTYYLPMDAFRPGTLILNRRNQSWCEWKGAADYWTVVSPTRRAPDVAWSYPDPTPDYRAIANHVAVYAHAMDRCTVNGEVVTPQPGNFYGGWVTSTIIGPFKGEPGTMGW
jgi:uncharacterized protein (DUF427 family)